mmetsp:Transcript_16555/g.21568  ORF Transcript_16555/g.21568 Transcript_16555/m.21568 type:complete len:88 (+) Transcript_16555:1079-1342(+)
MDHPEFRTHFSTSRLPLLVVYNARIALLLCLAYRLILCKEELTTTLLGIESDEKCLPRSVNILAGNEVFVARNFSRAVESYTKAINA